MSEKSLNKSSKKTGLNVAYYAKMAPLISNKEYTDLMKKYEETNKMPNRLKLAGMAVDSSMNSNHWSIPKEELDDVAKQLVEAQIRKDHSESVDAIMGKINTAWREDDRVFYEGEIADEDIIKKILLGYIKYDSIQVGSNDVYCANCVNVLHKRREEATIDNIDDVCPRCGASELIISHPLVIELSIVSLPAYEGAVFMPIGFKAALDKALVNRFHDNAVNKLDESSPANGNGVSGHNFPASREVEMSTVAPSGEIKDAKVVSYEDAMKALSGEFGKLSQIAESTYKLMLEESTARKKKEEEETKVAAEAKARLAEAIKRREEAATRIEARRKAAALLKEKMSAASHKGEEEEAKHKMDELKSKIEEVKKRVEEARAKREEAKKKAEASAPAPAPVAAIASGKGEIGAVKEESLVTNTGEIPKYWSEILTASNKFKELGLLQG